MSCTSFWSEHALFEHLDLLLEHPTQYLERRATVDRRDIAERHDHLEHVADTGTGSFCRRAWRRSGSVDALMDYLRQFADAGVAVLAISSVGRTKDSKGRSSDAGDYRIQFSVTPDKLIVERIGHRDGFYEG